MNNRQILPNAHQHVYDLTDKHQFPVTIIWSLSPFNLPNNNSPHGTLSFPVLDISTGHSEIRDTALTKTTQ